ncbi:MAG: OFA family MFS transporter [Deltaproteobacteria bacterium]|nr:OFA family MFS transporter [Deltaproteobacteria bacterium]
MSDTQVNTSKYRWIIVFAAFIIMMIISVYQYSWFLFAYAIKENFKWDLATIGLTFTIFTYTATFIQPLSGFISESKGPRKVAILASSLVGIGFILSSYASSPLILYLFYGLGGLGVGVLYGISTACAIKWFPDKRGFATGFVVFGFGAGTAVFNFIVQGLLEAKGVSTTFMYIGIFMIIILIPLSLFFKYPQESALRNIDTPMKAEEESQDYHPFEMLKSYQWFLIYFSFIATVSIVLMFGAQMKIIAKEFNVPAAYFSLTLFLFPIGNGLSRVLAGTVSDRIGREKTMVTFYTLLSIAIFCFVLFGHRPILFIVIVFIAALLGGAPFVLYPVTIGDYYGARYAATNYGITYTAKAWAGLISGWLSGYLFIKFGSYKIQLIVVAICSLLAAVLSIPVIMKSPRKKIVVDH